jgi:hypothetical protein
MDHDRSQRRQTGRGAAGRNFTADASNRIWVNSPFAAAGLGYYVAFVDVFA